MGIKAAFMEVEVLRAPTGVFVAKAWGTSRPNDTSSGIEDVIKIDVPVNEMEDLIVRMKVPIIFREMLFSLRDHVAWARTSRVDNLDEWEVATGYDLHPEVMLCYDTMQARKASETQDNYRELLPLVYLTEFTVKLSARTFIRFADGIHKVVTDLIVNGDDKDGYLLGMFSQFGILLKYALNDTPYQDVPIGTYGFADLLPKLESKSTGHYDKATRMGDFVHVYLKSIPIVLRAQIVRHRPIMFTDTLSSYVNRGAITAPINSRISLSMVMPAAMAVSMLRKRNCWIAQEDLWAPVIMAMNECFGDDGAFLLPCDGKDYCPVGRDNLLRHEGKDPAPACPLWYGFEDLAPSGQQRADIMGYMDKRHITKGMWENIYMQTIPDPAA